MNLDVSRRMLLQAGSLFGLALLSGCAGGGGGGGGGSSSNMDNAEAMPEPPFPEVPKLPPSPNTYAPAVAGGQNTWKPAPGGAPANTPAPLPSGQMVGVLPRSRWVKGGNEALRNPLNTRPMNGVSRITVHHDGMTPFFDPSEGGAIARLNTIRDAHAERLAKGTGEKWADIGYHFVIDPAGRVWEGRPLKYQGAHVQDQNEHNIGVMCMGNYESQSPTKATTDALDRFVLQLMKEYRINLGNVRTHREMASTACPGANLQTYMVHTRARGGSLALACANGGKFFIS